MFLFFILFLSFLFVWFLFKSGIGHKLTITCSKNSKLVKQGLLRLEDSYRKYVP